MGTASSPRWLNFDHTARDHELHKISFLISIFIIKIIIIVNIILTHHHGQHHSPHHHHGQEDEEAFRTFAVYCGLALHHAKLYDKIRRSEQKYKVACDVSDSVYLLCLS